MVRIESAFVPRNPPTFCWEEFFFFFFICHHYRRDALKQISYTRIVNNNWDPISANNATRTHSLRPSTPCRFGVERKELKSQHSTKDCVPRQRPRVQIMQPDVRLLNVNNARDDEDYHPFGALIARTQMKFQECAWDGKRIRGSSVWTLAHCLIWTRRLICFFFCKPRRWSRCSVRVKR